VKIIANICTNTASIEMIPTAIKPDSMIDQVTATQPFAPVAHGNPPDDVKPSTPQHLKSFSI
jgi:hypothetical protein